jgi:hypothetical protein
MIKGRDVLSLVTVSVNGSAQIDMPEKDPSREHHHDLNERRREREREKNSLFLRGRQLKRKVDLPSCTTILMVDSCFPFYTHISCLMSPSQGKVKNIVRKVMMFHGQSESKQRGKNKQHRKKAFCPLASLDIPFCR